MGLVILFSLFSPEAVIKRFEQRDHEVDSRGVVEYLRALVATNAITEYLPDEQSGKPTTLPALVIYHELLSLAFMVDVLFHIYSSLYFKSKFTCSTWLTLLSSIHALLGASKDSVICIEFLLFKSFLQLLFLSWVLPHLLYLFLSDFLISYNCFWKIVSHK